MWVLRLLAWCALLPALVLGQLHDNGKTKAVQWDRNSLLINGERLVIFSGEFHYPRIPVPELWPDIFTKLRASGYNAISVYFFWAYHSNSADGDLDFTSGAHDVQRLLDYALEAGIYVVARPGPYINAETTAGGLALWTTTGAFGRARDPSAAQENAWLPYITGLAEIFAKNGVDKGGPLILVQHDNEFQEQVHSPTWPGVLYMEQLTEAYDNANVTIPSTHNEVSMSTMSWSTDFEDVGGAVNVYGLDSYPMGFDCSNPGGNFNIIKSYYQWFQEVSPTQPSWTPEFQGGSFDPWGGAGYEKCAEFIGTNFTEVFYKNSVSQKVTLMNFYMSYGGTNWGGLAAPVVYTSYDYGAHISEGRTVRDKVREAKLLSLWLRVSDALRVTDMISNGTGIATSNTTAIYGTHLRNPDTNTGFYYVVQNSSPSETVVELSIELQTSLGNLTVSGIELAGRQSKFIVTDYTFGESTLLYSSAEIMTYALFEQPILILYLNEGQSAEFVLKTSSSTPTITGDSTVDVSTSTFNGTSATKVTYTQSAGKTVLQFPGDSGPQIWLVDRITAWGIWAPPLTSNPNVQPNEHLLVSGPYLVRSASVSGSTVDLIGDLNTTTTIELAAPANITEFAWNGATVSANKTEYGTLVATLPGPQVDLSTLLPDLESLTWLSADSLTERAQKYSDASWVIANHTTTPNPAPPETLPVLYADDYGFHVGIKLYRGYFSAGANGTAAPTSATINVTASQAFGFSVWLNGVFLQSFIGSPSSASGKLELSFANVTLSPTNNVLFVVVDYTGHDEEGPAPFGTRNPMGIIHASLDQGDFDSWKLVGNAGGEQPIDQIRGIYNEGGLRAERLGWPLPGAPVNSSTFTDTFVEKSPLTGLTAPGIEFYVANVTLSINKDSAGNFLDIPLALSVSASASQPARIQLYVNGYEYGKYIPHLGPQTVFPVPPGVINPNGVNTIGVSIWAMQAGGAKLDSIQLISQGVYTTGFSTGNGTGFAFDAAYLQPGWTPERLQFA